MNETSNVVSPPADRMQIVSVPISHKSAAGPDGQRVEFVDGVTLDLGKPSGGPHGALPTRAAGEERGAVTIGRVLRDRYVLEKR